MKKNYFCFDKALLFLKGWFIVKGKAQGTIWVAIIIIEVQFYIDNVYMVAILCADFFLCFFFVWRGGVRHFCQGLGYTTQKSTYVNKRSISHSFLMHAACLSLLTLTGPDCRDQCR